MCERYVETNDIIFWFSIKLHKWVQLQFKLYCCSHCLQFCLLAYKLRQKLKELINFVKFSVLCFVHLTCCVFKYARTPLGRVRLGCFARVRLLRHALPISLLISRKKKPDCFVVQIKSTSLLIVTGIFASTHGFLNNDH